MHIPHTIDARRNARAQVERAGIVRDLLLFGQLDRQIAQRHVRLRKVGREITLDALQRPLIIVARQRFPRARQRALRIARAVLLHGIARPERVLVQIQNVLRGIKPYHRAQPAVSQRQRLRPRPRGLTIKNARRRAHSIHSSFVFHGFTRSYHTIPFPPLQAQCGNFIHFSSLQAAPSVRSTSLSASAR